MEAYECEAFSQHPTPAWSPSILRRGTFALCSLLFRHGKFSLLPNQQAADEELSTYKYGSSSAALKRYLEKHKKKLRTDLLVVVFRCSVVSRLCYIGRPICFAALWDPQVWRLALQVETLSRDNLASILSLTVEAASVGPLMFSDSSITIMDNSTIDEEIKDLYIMRNYPLAYESSSDDNSSQSTMDCAEEQDRAV